MGGARVTTLVTLRKCTLGNKREIKTLKFVLASTKGFKGGLAWIKPSRKDMAVTLSYSKLAAPLMESLKGLDVTKKQRKESKASQKKPVHIRPKCDPLGSCQIP